MNVLLAKISIMCWTLSIPFFVFGTTNQHSNLRRVSDLLHAIALCTSISPVFDMAAGKYIENEKEDKSC